MKFHIAHIVPVAGTRSLMHGLLGYREVVEAVAWGLDDLGHEVSVGANSFRDGCVNIVFGAQMLAPADLSRLPPETIVYNFEQIGDTPVEQLTPGIRVVAERLRVWDYSRSNLKAWEAAGAQGRAVHVPVGWAPVLSRIAKPRDQDIDVLFYGSPSAARLSILTELSNRGATCLFVCGMYGAARDQLIARSKIVLNVNKHHAKIFEIVRVSYLMANAKAVVADLPPGLFVEPDIAAAIALCAIEEVPARCERLLDDPGAREQLETRAREAIQARHVTPILRAALGAVQ
jgi:hypothetical protein